MRLFRRESIQDAGSRIQRIRYGDAKLTERCLTEYAEARLASSVRSHLQRDAGTSQRFRVLEKKKRPDSLSNQADLIDSLSTWLGNGVSMPATNYCSSTVNSRSFVTGWPATVSGMKFSGVPYFLLKFNTFLGTMLGSRKFGSPPGVSSSDRAATKLM